MATEADALSRLRAWAASEGIDIGPDSPGWKSAQVGEIWVLTPPGRSNTVYVVTDDAVRAVHPSRESLTTVIEELSRS